MLGWMIVFLVVGIVIGSLVMSSCINDYVKAGVMQRRGHGFGDYEYIDIVSAGIDKEKLSYLVSKPVETIPQVFVNGESIGGYEEFAALVSTL